MIFISSYWKDSDKDIANKSMKSYLLIIHSYHRNWYFEIISAYHTGFDTLISLHNNPLVKYLKYLPAFQDFSSILQILVLRTFVCEPWNTTISCKHSTLFTISLPENVNWTWPKIPMTAIAIFLWLYQLHGGRQELH